LIIAKEIDLLENVLILLAYIAHVKTWLMSYHLNL